MIGEVSQEYCQLKLCKYTGQSYQYAGYAGYALAKMHVDFVLVLLL